MKLGFLLAVAMTLAAQTRDQNTFTSATAIAEGKRMYSFYCVNCHGMDGASGRGARLASKFRRFGSSDREMYQTISNGVPGSEMPGAWLDEDSIWKILSFVRTLEVQEVAACRSDPAAAERGKQIYAAKGGCAACHTIGMGGGRLGPDLTTIGATRTREHLRESLVEPGAAVAGRYRSVVVEVKGKKVEGVVLNEDDYSVHLMDRAETLRSFLKSEIGGIAYPRQSLMPAYGVSLSGAELEDLLDYICSLKGGRN